jgi:hypothetical protein
VYRSVCFALSIFGVRPIRQNVWVVCVACSQAGTGVDTCTACTDSGVTDCTTATCDAPLTHYFDSATGGCLGTFPHVSTGCLSFSSCKPVYMSSFCQQIVLLLFVFFCFGVCPFWPGYVTVRADLCGAACSALGRVGGTAGNCGICDVANGFAPGGATNTPCPGLFALPSPTHIHPHNVILSVCVGIYV